MHAPEDQIRDPNAHAPCQRWQVSQGLHDLSKWIVQLRTEDFPWLGDHSSPPLAKMPKDDWAKLNKLRAGFQDISTRLTERMYMPYTGPCKSKDKGLDAVDADAESQQKGQGSSLTRDKRAELQVNKKIKKAAEKAETVDEDDEEAKDKEADDKYCIRATPEPGPKGKLRKRGKKGVEPEEEDLNAKAYKEMRQDPARFFATVPPEETAKMKGLVRKLRHLAEKELPDVTNENTDENPPVDAAERYRYQMTMGELRNLATRTYLDMKRCGKVRPSSDILSRVQGSKAMNLRSGMQDDTLIYEREKPIKIEKQESGGGCVCM